MKIFSQSLKCYLIFGSVQLYIMFKDKQRRGATINAEFLEWKRKEQISRKMPNHEESCLLCKRLDSSLEIYKLVLISLKFFSSFFLISLRFFYVLAYAHIHTCVYNYMHVLVEESSPTLQFKSINSSALSFLHSPTLTSKHDHWKNHSLAQTELCW